MKEFHLEVVTPDGIGFSGNAESLLIHTTEGDVEFLAGHSDFVAALGTGRARILAEGKARVASVSGGFVSVSREGIRLVAVTFEFADEIDLERATAAKERAERAIADARDARAMELAKAKLARAVNRIKVAELI